MIARKSENKREGPRDSVREREGPWMARDSKEERGQRERARMSESEREVPSDSAREREGPCMARDSEKEREGVRGTV